MAEALKLATSQGRRTTIHGGSLFNFLTKALRHPWPEQELKLPHGLILTLTEVLDLTKAPSPELDSHHGHGQELSSSHPLILMAPYLTGLMMCEAVWGLVFG
jgi:hypothetical protein|uniref:Uncharacterized protein n=1 Tax=Fagus sylvatica TaxID=28930 RepID=A0A2N9HZ95_FAGSY